MSTYGRSSCILIGDFNFDIEKQQGYVLIIILLSLGFYNKIDKYTHVYPITNVDKACSNHVWHNCINTKHFIYVRPCFAGHNAILVISYPNFGQKPK